MKMKAIEVEHGFPLHGDILEFLLARVPLIDLASASRVSKSWEQSVSSSLLHLNKIKPWLILQIQCPRSFHVKSTYAYDPRSQIWLQLTLTLTLALAHPSILRSNSDFLYSMSPTAFSFSTDPLHLTWRHVEPPRSWRLDPIVSMVGSHIVVTGGASGFDEDPLSVEIYDMVTSRWSTCQPMPDILKDSAASTWLSVAANRENMYVMEKASGAMYSFSPETKAWSGPYDLRLDPGVFFSDIGFAGYDLILAGVIGHPQNAKGLKLWRIERETMAIDQIGEIPCELMGKLSGENSELSSISLLTANDFVYIYNNSDPVEIILCELGEGGCKWGSMKNLVLSDERRIGERMVMSCGMLGIGDLQKAISHQSPMISVPVFD